MAQLSVTRLRPGSYRFTVLHDGQIIGVIGVNAHSGEVWYDAWQ